MPLINSSSNEARNENIAREIEAGKPKNQAAAIAYAVQRRAEGHIAHQAHEEKGK